VRPGHGATEAGDAYGLMGRAWRPGSPGEEGLPRSHLRFRVAVRVEEATAASTELTAAMGRLVGQLSSSARAPTEAELQELVDSPATRLLVARDDDGTIVGSLTLALFSDLDRAARLDRGCGRRPGRARPGGGGDAHDGGASKTWPDG
jgi:hypothetical protein